MQLAEYRQRLPKAKMRCNFKLRRGKSWGLPGKFKRAVGNSFYVVFV
jgi:hypothetical protein